MYNCRPPGLSDDDSDDDFEFSTFENKQKHYQNNFDSVRQFANPEEELFDAVKSNDLLKVKELISNDVDLNSLQAGWTPLMYSCLHSLPEMTKLLLENGSNINLNKDFFTPLMAVCTNSILGSTDQKVECVKILLDHGVDINATDRFRTSALMLAAREGLTKIVQLLLDKNCEINRQDKDGWNALFHAVYCNKPDVVDVLLSYEPNLKLKDLRGQTAYDLAMNKGLESTAVKIKVESCSDKAEPTLFSVAPVVTLKQLLNELPSKNVGTNPGFPSDVYNLLTGINLQIYAECLFKNNIQLGEFLVMNSDQLKAMGVRFFTHRHKILTAIKRFHLYRWQKPSIGLKPKNETILLLDGVKLMGNTVRQVYVLQTSIQYVLLNKPEGYATDELKRIITNTLDVIDLLEKELITLKRYGKHIERIKKVRPVDLIVNEETKEKRKKLLKVSIICAIGAIVLWKNRNHFLSNLKLM